MQGWLVDWPTEKSVSAVCVKCVKHPIKLHFDVFHDCLEFVHAIFSSAAVWCRIQAKRKKCPFPSVCLC